MISILFILVLVLILIAYGYYKTSDTLEVIHLKEFNVKEFQGLRNMNIPILFDISENHSNIKILDFYLNHYINIIENNVEYKIKLKDFFNEKKEDRLIVMNNESFINNTLLNLKISKIIKNIEPNFFSLNKNIIFINKNSYCHMKYNIDENIYLHIIKGKVQLKLFLPNHADFLNEYYNEILNEYISDYDIWKTSDNLLECIDLYMYENNYIKIPKFWWYTIKAISDNTAIGEYKTNSLISYLLTIPYSDKNVRDIITT